MTKELLLVAAMGWTLALAVTVDSAQGQLFAPAAPANPYASLLPVSATYPATSAPPVITEWQQPGGEPVGTIVQPNSDLLPTSASWVVPGDQQPGYVDAEVYCDGDPYPQQSLFAPPGSDAWCWQVLPDGLIYRSYWAGVHESRLGVVMIKEGGDSFWDATVGGRVGLVRYGDGDPFHPHGWQLDFEGAAQPRLTLDNVRDLETVDFRAGVPLTYGIDNWQFKIGYYHLSSHLGDEFAIANPGSLAERINYVRDALVLGASYYLVPEMRLYSEAGYSLNATGGAEPWEFQFGTELAKAGPTGFAGSPFLALNVHLREEQNFGGDFTAQTGWLWRGMSGQTVRIGAHYFNGKSSQYETFDDFEQQVGFGMWYDF